MISGSVVQKWFSGLVIQTWFSDSVVSEMVKKWFRNDLEVVQKLFNDSVERSG